MDRPTTNVSTLNAIPPSEVGPSSTVAARGKHFTIVQGIGPESWKWMVHLDEKSAKAGEAPSRAAAMNNVVWAIDKALRAKKPKPMVGPKDH